MSQDIANKFIEYTRWCYLPLNSEMYAICMLRVIWMSGWTSCWCLDFIFIWSTNENTEIYSHKRKNYFKRFCSFFFFFFFLLDLEIFWAVIKILAVLFQNLSWLFFISIISSPLKAIKQKQSTTIFLLITSVI